MKVKVDTAFLYSAATSPEIRRYYQGIEEVDCQDIEAIAMLYTRVQPPGFSSVIPNLHYVDRYNETTNHYSIVWTSAMQRLYVLVSHALRNNEPVLLVGETGCGETTACQILAEAFEKGAAYCERSPKYQNWRSHRRPAACTKSSCECSTIGAQCACSTASS
jgi:transcriptional regulator with AAA-type ATPase domain